MSNEPTVSANTEEYLEQIYRRLLEYDVEIKTGRIAAEAALDSLVGALTSS